MAATPNPWTNPQPIMITDKKEIAYIEIGLDGKYSVTRQQNGTLHHTNHFVNETMLDSNIVTASPSSLTRYNRINELLSGQKRFTLNDFIRFSNDRHDGLHDSLERLGESSSIQSVAAFIVHISPSGASEIYLKLRETLDQKGNETVQHFTAKQLFQNHQTKTALVDNTPTSTFTFAFQTFFQGLYNIFLPGTP